MLSGSEVFSNQRAFTHSCDAHGAGISSPPAGNLRHAPAQLLVWLRRIHDQTSATVALIDANDAFACPRELVFRAAASIRRGRKGEWFSGSGQGKAWAGCAGERGYRYTFGLARAIKQTARQIPDSYETRRRGAARVESRTGELSTGAGAQIEILENTS